MANWNCWLGIFGFQKADHPYRALPGEIVFFLALINRISQEFVKHFKVHTACLSVTERRQVFCKGFGENSFERSGFSFTTSGS